jgi:hypothetical protein
MTDFDEALNGAASAILKRELSSEERHEFLELAGVIGMGSVEDYLYMLMVFKRNEDRITCKIASFEAALSEKLNEISTLEKKINGTLEAAIERILGDGAARIGADMGEKIAAGAERTLTTLGEYRSIRGQTMLACFVCVASAIAYRLGAAGFLESVSDGGVLRELLFLPAGWCVFFCGAAHTFFWVGDHWGRIKKTVLYKAFLGVQVFLLSALAMTLL